MEKENNKDNPQDAGKEVALKDGWGEETTAKSIYRKSYDE